MNDTTRDELVADVQKAISDTFNMANEYRYNDKSGGAQGGVDILAKALSADIVRMVTAARDAEIRELLLTHADGYIVAKGQDGEAEAAFATKPWMEQILDAIDLGEGRHR